MPASYLSKIQTREAILAAIGPRPRARSVIMCHGVFDIVHPGHLRHLMYAKEKADILVASLTADAHILKANHRPFVPQELRAANLAALEMVDFVLIDPDPVALKNIAFLQPDFFAKGYEYAAGGLPPATQDEVRALEAYGGEMVFTPGDIVYSSSALIEAHPPRLAIEKLMTLMQSDGVSWADLYSALERAKDARVHVVGDAIVDIYSHCTLLGPSTKSPSFCFKHDRTEQFAGGAAIVAKHLAAAGADVHLTTVVGNDAARDFLVDDLTRAGVKLNATVDRTRPTTQKERFVTGTQKLMRVDRVDHRPVSEKIIQTMVQSVESAPADIVIFSDFRHGVFTRSSIARLRAAIPQGALTVADSQVSNRWGNILDFSGFDLITPNEREARFALADQDSVVRPLAAELFRRAGCRHLILKLGERGLMGYRSGGSAPREFFTTESFADYVTDALGAGDTLLAYASLALRASGSLVVASILGSFAAALQCERTGNVTICASDVRERAERIAKQATPT